MNKSSRSMSKSSTSSLTLYSIMNSSLIGKFQFRFFREGRTLFVTLGSSLSGLVVVIGLDVCCFQVDNCGVSDGHCDKLSITNHTNRYVRLPASPHVGLHYTVGFGQNHLAWSLSFQFSCKLPTKYKR